MHSFFGIAESASAFFYQTALTGFGTGFGSGTLASGAGSGDPLLDPALGPVHGGTIVSVVGQNFANSASLSCRFGAASYTVIARFLTSRTVECVSPAHPAGEVALQLSLNGQQFVSLGATYLFHEVPIIVAIEPSRGPVEGGMLMTIHGNHFRCMRPMLVFIVP
jgi:hypothetical protein